MGWHTTSMVNIHHAGWTRSVSGGASWCISAMFSNYQFSQISKDLIWNLKLFFFGKKKTKYYLSSLSKVFEIHPPLLETQLIHRDPGALQSGSQSWPGPWQKTLQSHRSGAQESPVGSYSVTGRTALSYHICFPWITLVWSRSGPEVTWHSNEEYRWMSLTA